MKPFQLILLLMLTVAVAGCKSEPVLTQVTGTLTKNGTPVNNAQVRFVPVDETLGEYIGSGISDEEGKFTITIPGRPGDVCCTGKCKVTIREAPVPGDVRGQLESGEGREGGNALMKYKASLKNRPLPREYERLHSTPLLFDVTPEPTSYDIEL